jgi:hypothetical protein
MFSVFLGITTPRHTKQQEHVIYGRSTLEYQFRRGYQSLKQTFEFGGQSIKHWLEQFKETGSVSYTKGAGRPSVDVELFQRS